MSAEVVSSPSPSTAGFHHRRGLSLSARFPGDQSHRPLDIIRAEQTAVNRPRRRTRVGADTIDQLDIIGANGIPYHHDGPYDATLLARNINFKSSPVAATQQTNEEALRATPQEFIYDSVRGHRPLVGTASVPPGNADRFGRVMEYQEGPNLNVEMGWRRWEGIDYHPDDIKGKGEPNYSRERALKNHKSHRRFLSEGDIELREMRHLALDSNSGVDARNSIGTGFDKTVGGTVGGIQRSNTTGKRTSGVAGALRSRFGSLRRRKQVGEHM